MKLTAEALRLRMAIVVLKVWTDDHLPCVAFNYKSPAHGFRNIAIWWTDQTTIGALHFPDSSKAQAHLKDLLDVLDNCTTEQLKQDDFGGLDSDFGNITIYEET